MTFLLYLEQKLKRVLLYYRQNYRQFLDQERKYEMSRKGENIYKRKDGRWEGRFIKLYDEDDKAKYGSVYARTYVEVRKKLLECQLNSLEALETDLKKIEGYEAVLWSWLQSMRIKVKESSYARYYYLIQSHINPSLGKHQINKISADIVERTVEELLQNGRVDGKGGLAAKTVTDIVMVIKSAMNYAEYSGYAVSCNLKRLTVKKTEKEIRVLSRQEQTQLNETLMKDMNLYKLGILTSLYTGIRIGELCALQWEHFDLDREVLKIKRTMQRIQNTSEDREKKTKIVITEPKSRSSIREIPLPQFLTKAIKKYKSKAKSFFLTGEEDRFVEPRTMQNHFKKYIRASGIEDANFHALRHTFATRCIELGFEIKSLSEILGHANVNITLDRYVHASFELKKENMEKLSMM